MCSIRVRGCRLSAVRIRPRFGEDGDLAALRISLQTVLDGIVRAFSVSLRGEGGDTPMDAECAVANDEGGAEVQGRM